MAGSFSYLESEVIISFGPMRGEEMKRKGVEKVLLAVL